ncbi:MAG: hypothetical protein WCK28_00245 [Burkholderiales bacterium]|jgi:hypothetical protein
MAWYQPDQDWAHDEELRLLHREEWLSVCAGERERAARDAAAARRAPESTAFRPYIGSRAATRDRTARSLREAFPAERVAAIELDTTPRFDPERWIVAPGLAAAAVFIVVLLVLERLA